MPQVWLRPDDVAAPVNALFGAMDQQRVLGQRDRALVNDERYQNALLQERADVRSQNQAAASSEQELLGKWEEISRVAELPEQYQAQWVAQNAPEYQGVPPSQVVRAAQAGLAARMGKTLPGQETGTGFGNVNPGDYTPESLAKYAQTRNYADLRRQYAPPPPPNMTTIQLPQGQVAFNPRTGETMPLSSREEQRAAEVADVSATKQAEATAAADVEKRVKDVERQTAFRMYDTAMAGLRQGLGATRTGPVSGRIPAVTAPQQTAEGAVAAMAPILKQMFRAAGEGTFTDRDQALLLDMVPKRTDLPEAREAKIANIDAIVRAKLGVAEPPASGPVKVRSVQDAAKLPPGTEFETPDGKRRVRK